jgi:hypothetical protein
MAHLDIVKVTNVPGTKNLIFYNVDLAVGKNGSNKTEDVLLVQYLLKECLKLPAFSYIPGTSMAGTAQEGTIENLIISGVWDGRWQLYLDNFQNQLKRNHRNTLVDGRVDPVLNHLTLGSISHTQYTILSLNVGYGQRRPNELPKLASAGDCPAALRESLNVRFPVF